MSTINFNDGIFVQEALKAFVAALTPLNAFSHSYNSATAKPGNAVYVPRVEALTATTFSYSDNSGFPYEDSGGTINTITVNLNNQYRVTCDITDLQAANSSAAEMSNFAMNQGKALGKQVLQTIWSLLTTVNFGVALVNVSIANYGRQAMTSVRTAIAKRDVPMDNLSMIVNEDAHNSFLNDSTFYQAYAFGTADAIVNGRVKRALGFDIYETNILPTNSISLVGVAVHSDGIAVACRYLEPQEPGAYAAVERVVDGDSGIVMGYRRHFSPGRGKHFATFEALFGYAVGLSLGVGIMTRSD